MDSITSSVLGLLNDYPGLGSREMSFSVLDENKGIAMFPLNGAVIESSVKDICGNTSQIIVYPFMVCYRAGNLSEERRGEVKEWLDDLGRWLEKQPIEIGETTYQLTDYPTLDTPKRWIAFQRQAPAYLDGIHENNAEDWVLSLVGKYYNEF